MRVRNVNDLYWRGCRHLSALGVKQDSRNGQVLSLEEPRIIRVDRPWERVLFSPSRNVNHVFHLMESLWMLAGRRDVAFLDQFNKNMVNFSDDGEVFNAAYGYRWRQHFGYDQIQTAINMLKADPDNRRVVIGMWDPSQDLGGNSRDYPCNTSIMCRIVGGALNFTITNRSNDLVWGLCGANAVHMSMLQEYMAAAIGVKCGVWWHMTNNLHVYEKHWELIKEAESVMYAYGVPDDGTIWNYPKSQPLVAEGEDSINFVDDCIDFTEGNGRHRTKFFEGVVWPMYKSWQSWKEGQYVDAITLANSITAQDWKIGLIEWYKRALKRKQDGQSA